MLSQDQGRHDSRPTTRPYVPQLFATLKDPAMQPLISSLLICSLLAGTASGDERIGPPGVEWQGSVALGAELDDNALPKEKDDDAVPSRWRVGFSANWSFLLRWERVEANSDEKPADVGKLSADEAKLIELTNAERKKLKLPALRSDPALMKLARDHAATMARLGQVGHDLEGKSFAQRMERAKYQASRAGENVAEGQRTPDEAVADWLASPGHKGNILHSDYTCVGVGLAKSKAGKWYWTQVFAKPFPAPK
jgi:uncharacterized protein YkwD